MSNLTLRSSLSTPLTSTQVDANFVALNTTKAELNSPTFTGTPKSTTKASIIEASTLAELSTKIGNTDLITSEWFQSQLAKISVTAILPSVTSVGTPIVDTDSQSPTFQDQIGTSYAGTDLGSDTKRFANLFVQNIVTAAETITIGTAALKGSDEGGIVLPANTALGSAENVLPVNLASSVLDKGFASSFNTKQIKLTFVSSDEILTVPAPVWLTTTGTVKLVSTSEPQNGLFIGFATSTAAISANTTVVISGPVEGFSSLINNAEYFLNTDGSLTNISSSTNVKIGKAVNQQQLFLYSTTTLDTYALAKSKVGLENFSIGTDNVSSGSGGITYDNTTGVFKYTPAAVVPNNAVLSGIPTAPTAPVNTNTQQIATTAFVEAATAALVNSAPELLDTLAEIATAIGNDGNFATTINNLITGLQSSKANLASPTFTGVVSVPTPSASSDDTTVATTAFVRNTSATLNDANLTGVPTAPTATVGTNTEQLANTAFVFRAVAQGGGASNMDGGVAQTVRNIATHHFDGGSASG